MSNGDGDSSLAPIGDTQLLRRRVVSGESAQVLVKIETGNTTGSHQDRTALAIIEESERRGVPCAGQPVVETHNVGRLRGEHRPIPAPLHLSTDKQKGTPAWT